MIHEIAVGCTCRAEDTYAGIVNDGKDRRRDAFCSRCGGSGWLYRDAQYVRGLATSIRSQRNILDAGIAQPGDMLFSPVVNSGSCLDAARRIGAWDRLTATWTQALDDGHVLIRGAGTAGENAGRKTYLEDDEDRLWYEPGDAVWCEDEDDVVYRHGTDFVFGPGRIIRWVGARPRNRLRYSIKYHAYFEWIVFAPPTERRDRDAVDIGAAVMLRKRHIVHVNDSPTALAGDKVSAVSRVTC